LGGTPDAIFKTPAFLNIVGKFFVVTAGCGGSMPLENVAFRAKKTAFATSMKIFQAKIW